MFEHPLISKYAFEEVPLDRDVYLMDEEWLTAYERALTQICEGGKFRNVGYISYAAARSVGPASIELSWYPNIFDRFHQVRVSLPRDQFITCVDCWQYDEKPHIFVRTGWLTNLHMREYSVFALVDAIGVKSALAKGTLTRDRLIQVRDRIDAISAKYPTISFLSFADSLLLKSNWTVGTWDSNTAYTYEPEVFIALLLSIRSVYRDILGLEIYAVLSQGSNEYFEDALLHISPTQNHISLNSLGLPFAQLQAIERKVRSEIRSGGHRPADLYMDENFYRSLRFKHEFHDKLHPSCSYKPPMGAGQSRYFYNALDVIFANLDRGSINRPLAHRTRIRRRKRPPAA